MIQIDCVAPREPEPSSIFHEEQSNGISDEVGFASPAMDLGYFLFFVFFFHAFHFNQGDGLIFFHKPGLCDYELLTTWPIPITEHRFPTDIHCCLLLSVCFSAKIPRLFPFHCFFALSLRLLFYGFFSSVFPFS